MIPVKLSAPAAIFYNGGMRKRFVIHEHHATNLHWDLRLEMGVVYRSWAVPKGPSRDPSVKRLAVAVGDHSIEYGSFEGTIPPGKYGAGEVRIWDDGKYETASDPEEQMRNGKIVFTFYGLKLRGEFALVRLANDEKNWLLIKANDHFADVEWKLETVLEPKKSRKKLSLLARQRGNKS
ncbi:MAG: 3'-phosphoesterase [Saprospiraceae bacterium]|nr:3'-phosphoesterase [Pyrinomonadaceae bacterium]